MVDVTIEALKSVKSALADFKTETETVAARANAASQKIVDECRTCIANTQGEVERSKMTIERYEKDVDDLEQAIIDDSKELDRLKNLKTESKKNIAELDCLITDVRQQISLLQAQLSETEDEKTKSRIQEEIDELNSQMISLCDKKQKTQQLLEKIEKKSSELNQRIEVNKSKKSQTEILLEEEKRRFEQLSNKLSRQKYSFTKISDDLNEYVSIAKRFQSNSIDVAHSEASAVEQCIDSIDAYLITSI